LTNTVGVTSDLKQRLAEHNAASADSNGFFAILACKGAGTSFVDGMIYSAFNFS
jgi:hypothetical protein